MVNERSIDGAKKRKWRKTKDFHTLVAGEDTKRALGHVQKVSQRRPEQVTEGKSNSDKSTATVVDLRAVVRR